MTQIRRPRHAFRAWAAPLLWAAAASVHAQTTPPTPAGSAAPLPLASPATTNSAGNATPSARPWTLDALLQLAREASPLWAAERARVDAARAGVITARAIPNPEIEVMPGRLSPRLPGASSGGVHSLSVTQALEMPGLRAARRGEAEANARAVGGQAQAALQNLLSDVRLGYYQVLRRDAELRAAEEDLQLLQQIRQRVQARVQAGEAPRFEQIRAETEVLNAERQAAAAKLRIDQARAELRSSIGSVLPEDFRVVGSLLDPVPAGRPNLGDAETWLNTHPLLVAARADLQAAESRTELEQRRAAPTVALRGAFENGPDTRQQQVGVLVSVPLFDRREGPIAEARAQVVRARALLAERELALRQARELALRQYDLADSQVRAFEGGIVREAESALRVAQAAYRFGERGILDTLDAQRSLRAARNELNTARFERWAALAEIERLRATAQP